MSDKQQRLGASLKELIAQPGIAGAALVRRDGVRVIDAWKRDKWNRETFSAMSATLMGAAEIALSDVAGARTRRVIAETSQMRMGVLDITDEIVLVAIGDASLPLDKFLQALEAASADMSGILGRELPAIAPPTE